VVISTPNPSMQEVEAKKKKVAAAKIRLERAKEKVKVEHDNLDSLEKRTEELAKLLDKEEENFKLAQKDVVELREKHFKATEELHIMKTAGGLSET
jgi:phage-related tail protein